MASYSEVSLVIAGYVRCSGINRFTKVKQSILSSWTDPGTLENEAQRPPKWLPEASRRAQGALGTLWGWFGGFLGRLQDTPGRSWGPRRCVFGGFGVLLGRFLDDFEALEAKTTKCLKVTTLSMKIIYLGCPKDPKVRHKLSLRPSLS